LQKDTILSWSKPAFIVNLKASDLLGNTTKVRPTSWTREHWNTGERIFCKILRFPPCKMVQECGLISWEAVQDRRSSPSHNNTSLEPAFLDHFGGRKSEDFAENPLPRISMYRSSRCWSDFGRISQQIRGFQIDYECGLIAQKCKITQSTGVVDITTNTAVK
jgi:hypothetical protein